MCYQTQKPADSGMCTAEVQTDPVIWDVGVQTGTAPLDAASVSSTQPPMPFTPAQVTGVQTGRLDAGVQTERRDVDVQTDFFDRPAASASSTQHAVRRAPMQVMDTPPADTQDWGAPFQQTQREKIQLVTQDGANCGCFASGMALASMLPGHSDRGSRLAKAIERVAVAQNLSSIGEMYDADALAQAINSVLADSSVVGAANVGNYLAQAASFDDEAALQKILLRAESLGVSVLIPYVAEEHIVPDTSRAPCTPEQMSDAHWCAVLPTEQRFAAVQATGIDDSCAFQVAVRLYEGNNSPAVTLVSLTDLVQSNQSLADAMNWNAYINQSFRQDAFDRYCSEFDEIIDTPMRSIQSTEPQKSDDILVSFLNGIIYCDYPLTQEYIDGLIARHFHVPPKTRAKYSQAILTFFESSIDYTHPNDDTAATIGALCERQSAKPEAFQNEAPPSWLGGSVYDPDEILLEKVSLRGRIILIGKKAAAPATPVDAAASFVAAAGAGD